MDEEKDKGREVLLQSLFSSFPVTHRIPGLKTENQLGI
jgi:hypothetical protein